MWQRVGALALGVALAGMASGAPPARQAQYDAAQAAMDRGDWAAAASGFEPLLPTDPHKPLSRSNAVIAARLGEALMHLHRADEAADWLERAAADLPRDAALAAGWLDLGEAARFVHDYDLAMRADRTALDLAGAANDAVLLSRARIALAQAAMTVDPKMAADALDAVIATDADRMAPLARAQLEALRARAAIIGGDPAAARRWITGAVARSGGMVGDRVSAAQAEIRADAAIIARLSGNEEETRRYLTYTGAGHLDHMDWIGGRSGDLPTCDAEAGVQPEDSVVMRLVVGDDGQVQAAVPVYASRPGPGAAVFARAVSQWRWSPDDLKHANLFTRGTLRLELRCLSRPGPAALAKPFYAETGDWLAAHGHLGAGAAAALREGQAGTRALSGNDALAAALFGHPAPGTTPLSFAEAQQALEAAEAPAGVQAVLAYGHAVERSGGNGVRELAAGQRFTLARTVPALLARFPRDKAPLWLTLEWALSLESAGRFDAAQPLVAQVLSSPDAILPNDDPLRQVAALHAALIGAKLGKPVAGPTPAGLDAAQCSLFDTRPIPASVSLSSGNFPDDALRWGFEGHVEEAFDIGSDGRVANVRTVLAYPPFVFGPTTERAVGGFRYVPPTLGHRAVGCDSQTVRINFILPK